MKQKILKYLNRIAYPQSLFASGIVRYLDKSKENVLVDVPCGRGTTTASFAKLQNIKTYGYDIDKEAIALANNNFKSPNLTFEVKDIFSAIPFHKNAEYFCVINSLFLLPEPERILKEVKLALKDNGTFFVIVPNTEGPNFRWFETYNKGVNKLILSEGDLQSYFTKNGWAIQKMIPMIYAHTYGRSNLIAYSPFSPFILRIMNFFQSIFKIGAPNYFLLVLKKGVE